MLTDKFIMIITMLFILSMVAERLATFIKLNITETGIKFPGTNIFILKPLYFRSKQKSSTLEKIRERNILGIALSSSLITALSIKANLIEILQSNDSMSTLGWGNSYLWDYGMYDAIKVMIGCSLTALFISIGSKFWHDLLDLLLSSKNLKEKVLNKETYKFDELDELDEWLKLTETDLIGLAISQHENLLKSKFENILYLQDTILNNEGNANHYLGIYLKDDNNLDIPSSVPVKLVSGKAINIKTLIVPKLGEACIQYDLNSKLAKENTFYATGSCGCVLHNDKQEYFLLSNCHVFTDGNLLSPGFNANGTVILDDDEIGNWFYGAINRDGDFSLVKIEDFKSWENPQNFSFKSTRIIQPEDFGVLKIQISGNKSKTDGFVVGIFNNQLSMRYNYGLSQKFNQVIIIGKYNSIGNNAPISKKGDSGAAVYDQNKNIIGIIVGADEKYTYALPIANFIKSFNLKLYQHEN